MVVLNILFIFNFKTILLDLKKFISKTISTSVFFVVFYFIFSTAIIYFCPFLSSKVFFKQDWLRINERIETSKRKIQGDTIYVGCSVAGQLFPYNKNNQLTSNGSTYPIGNYFLIKNAIKNNPNIKSVIYMTVPDVIGHNLCKSRTYKYFVKPFYTFENKKEILSSQEVSKVLEKNLFLDLCLFDSYKLLSIDDYNYSNGEPESFSMSTIAMEWLSKIDSLCTVNNVEFQIASPPVPISKKIKSNNWSEIKSKIHGTDLEPLFNTYFKTILYLDDKYLRDHIHWKSKIISANKLFYINTIKNRLNKAQKYKTTFK